MASDREQDDPLDGQLNQDAEASDDEPKPDKNHKYGVIYLSYIPPGMSVKKVRDIFGRFGEIGRVYLEPTKSRNGNSISFDEGWVEFKKKRIAKDVAAKLNGVQVGGKRKNRFYDSIWSIKYLHRFKWGHLTEQMNYEKALRDQRLRFEMGRAKKEAEFYGEQVDELKRRKRKHAETSEQELESRSGHYSKKQRLTDEEIRAAKKEQNKKNPNSATATDDVDSELIARIFS
jgi:ESF2/ABP1 family protein